MKQGPDDPRKSHGEMIHRTDGGIDLHLEHPENPARRLDELKLSRLLDGRPWVTLLAGVSLDGRSATKTGDSNGLLGDQAQSRRWEIRAQHDAVVVGVDSVLADKSILTSPDPVEVDEDWLRIVLDPMLKTPSSAGIVRTRPDRTLVVHGPDAAEDDRERLNEAGVRIVEIAPTAAGDVAIRPFLNWLFGQQVRSLLVEGFPDVQGAFADHFVVDEAVFFLGPVIVGGEAPAAIGGNGISNLADACRLRFLQVRRIGPDVELRALRMEEAEDGLQDPSRSGYPGGSDA